MIYVPLSIIVPSHWFVIFFSKVKRFFNVFFKCCPITAYKIFYGILFFSTSTFYNFNQSMPQIRSCSKFRIRLPPFSCSIIYLGSYCRGSFVCTPPVTKFIFILMRVLFRFFIIAISITLISTGVSF